MANAAASSNEAPDELPFHPLAELFPLMNGAEFEGLKADIAEHGQLEVIVTLDGSILDGRNRYRACRELGVEPKLIEWSGVGSPQAFVVSHNLHRRHLNESQRSMIAARLATGRLGRNQSAISGSANLQVLTKTQASKLLNVGERTVYDAQRVLREGTEEEVAAVWRGEASVATLANQISKNIAPTKRVGRLENNYDQRTKTRREHAQLWGMFRDSLDNLTGMPSVSDMVRIVHGQDRGRKTHTKLSIALNWLQEFSDAWNRS